MVRSRTSYYHIMNLVKRGSIWHAEIKTPHGTQSISTKQTDKALATKAVKDAGLKEMELAGQAGRMTNEALSKIVTGKKLSIEKAVKHYGDWLITVGKSPKTAENNTTTVLAWARFAKVENLSPAAINESHISPWINDPTAEAKASTREVKLAAIRSFFGFCSAKGWAIGDPAKLVRVNMKLMSHAQKEVQERVPLEAWEVKRLKKQLNEADDIFWLFAVTISNEIGLRLGDICQLEWDCFNFAGHIVVWTDKRDTRIKVPISDELNNLLARIPVHSHRYLFPEEREIINDVKRRASLSVKFSRILKVAGIEGKSFHCLRHTCATRWDKEGKTLESIGEDLGHTDTKTTKGYVH